MCLSFSSSSPVIRRKKKRRTESKSELLIMKHSKNIVIPAMKIFFIISCLGFMYVAAITSNRVKHLRDLKMTSNNNIVGLQNIQNRGVIDNDDVFSTESFKERFIPSNLIFVTMLEVNDPRAGREEVSNIEAWKEMYIAAGYAVYHYSLENIESFVRSEYPEHLSTLNSCKGNEERLDFARYLVLYHHGGILVNPTVSAPIVRLDALDEFHSEHGFVVGIDQNFLSEAEAKRWMYSRQKGIASHCIMAARMHFILKELLAKVHQNLTNRASIRTDIENFDYPNQFISNPQKMHALERSWISGSGALSEVIFSYEDRVSIVSSKTLMHLHPGGLRFDKLQNHDIDSITTHPAAPFIKYDESHLLEPLHAVRKRIYFAGIIRDASQISRESYDYILELSCKYGVYIHIIAGEGVEQSVFSFNALKSEIYGDISCADYKVLREPENVGHIPNRVRRIAYLRDIQREDIRMLLEGGYQDDVVIIADIDLYSFPDIRVLMNETEEMASNHNEQVLCASGEMFHPYGYYDTFATVLLPDTFVYPLRGRLVPEFYPGEDRSKVRANDVYGNFTQLDLLHYFKREINGRDNLVANDLRHERHTPVPVRSCFGGLAIYDAKYWLDGKCRYNMNTTHLIRYANRMDGVPCEHVVFHDCMVSSNPDIVIAIQPNLVTYWNNPDPFGDRLVPSDINHSLVTYAKYPEKADMLVNGNFILRINEEGRLVIEKILGRLNNSTEKKDIYTRRKIVWMANRNARKPSGIDWTNMFLVLNKNGNLQLIKNVPNKKNSMGHFLCKQTADSCRITVWKSNSAQPSPEMGTAEPKYALILDSSGVLKIIDEVTQKLIWINI